MSISKQRLNQVLRDERGSLAIPVHPLHLLEHDLHLLVDVLEHKLLKATVWANKAKAQIRPIHLALAGGALLAIYSVGFLWPRSVTIAYSGSTCFTNPTFLPKAVSARPSNGFKVQQNASLSIAGFPLYSHGTCVEPTQAPTQNAQESVKLAPLGLGFLAKNIKVSTGALPSVSSTFESNRPVSTKHPLVFSLDKKDELFDYRLGANGQTVNCLKQGSELSCGLHKLALGQAQTYEFTLERLFDDQPTETVFKNQLVTVEPVQVTSSSITPSQLVFAQPSEFTVTFNKLIKSFDGLKLERILDGSRPEVPVTSELKDNVLTIRFSQSLARDASFELIIYSAESNDQGFLSTPYILPFRTSGGPKVAGVSIGSYKVSTENNIVLTFDAGLAGSQALPSFISLTAGGSLVDAVISQNGRTVTINPRASLPRCTGLSLKVGAGLVNEFGVGEGQAWSFASRTICQTVFSIGGSVKGRGITAYRFGTGSSKIIFVGGTHGNEKSSVYILNSFVDDLERNAGNIPANRTVVVIPNLNPDGFAASSRTNANNVDLNRNFPSNNWQTGIYMPGNIYLPNGGGSEPLSEPESRALANYVSGQSPRLVLTYHAVARVVISNDAGDSWALAQSYGSKSGFRAVTNSESDGEFSYPTTGEFEDWMNDKLGLPALLIELATMSGNEFGTHKSAIWTMAGLP